jgi:hypothetical protein
MPSLPRFSSQALEVVLCQPDAYQVTFRLGSVSSKPLSERRPTHNNDSTRFNSRDLKVVLCHSYHITLPSQVRLFNALERKKAGPRAYARFADRVADELFITGQAIFDWFTPRTRRHTRFWTWAFAAACFCVFFFMAGEYPAYLQNVRYAGQTDRAVSQRLSQWSSSAST